MARLLNKVLAFGLDVAADFLMTESAYRLKSIVGHDPLVAERKNSNDDFHFKGDLIPIITANVRLLIRLHGDFDKSAWFRRLGIINFCRRQPLVTRISRFDEVPLKEEGSGILNWGISGLLGYYKDEADRGDIILSQEQIKRADQLLSESDGLRTFITEELVEASYCSITSDELVQAFTAYAKTKKWRAWRRRKIECDSQDLIQEIWAITQSHNLQYNGKNNVRGYWNLRCRLPGDPPFSK